MTTFKKKLIRKELLLGSWITIGEPAIAEIMAKAGFEWLTVDMEHTAISMSQCQELIRVIDLCGKTPLVRVGSNDPLLIKRTMDSGAHGVIVPMVNSRSDAEKAVSAAKYPPWGSRGVGLSRAQGYGTSLSEYKKWAEEESIVIVQIEHIEAVENLENILAVEGVDAFIVGPYDLSGSLGIPGCFEDDKMIEALKKIKNISAKIGTPSGYHVVSTSYKKVTEKIKEGYTLISYGVDFLFIGESCRSGLNALKKKSNKSVKKNLQ